MALSCTVSAISASLPTYTHCHPLCLIPYPCTHLSFRSDILLRGVFEASGTDAEDGTDGTDGTDAVDLSSDEIRGHVGVELPGFPGVTHHPMTHPFDAPPM